MYWYFKVWKKCFDFEGRARRKEFWMFAFIHAILISFLSIGMNFFETGTLFWVFWGIGMGYIFTAYIPMLAVNVRRLHDIGKSGWWLLLFLGLVIPLTFLGFFVPIVPINEEYAIVFHLLKGISGILWIGFLILMCRDSLPNPNRYGPNPKTIATPSENVRHP